MACFSMVALASILGALAVPGGQSRANAAASHLAAKAVSNPSSPFISWTETTLQDFADGELDPALYVSRRAELESDSGCVEFSTYFDANHDGFYDLMCTEWDGPYVRLWFGTDSGYGHSEATYPLGTGGGAMLADLNADRNPELLVADGSSTVIYWGTPTGPSPSNRTTLGGHGVSEAVNAADFDRDGYIDIAVGCYDGSGTFHIFWGSPTGYSSSNQMTISVGANVLANIEIGDFNRDGWLDIALAKDRDNVVIYMGPGRTCQVVHLPFANGDSHGLSTADLDGDGWLDLVFTEYGSLEQSYIYWGSRSGFSTSRRTILDVSPAYGGSAIADVNRDGRLDVVYFRGYGPVDPPLAFYNTGAYPFFDNSHSQELGSVRANASGGITGDFNFDSIPDFYVCSGEYNSDYIIYGPDYTRADHPFSNRDHHGSFREPGNVYDRSLSAWYLSSIRDAGPFNRFVVGNSSWISREPNGAHLVVAYRSGPTPVPDTSWTHYATVSGSGGAIPDSGLGYRYLQYRVIFQYPRPNALAELEEITSYLVIAAMTDLDVGVERILAPRDTVDSGTVTVPTVAVHNYGNRAATFPVRFSIGSLYAESTTVTLNSGAEETLSFRSWTALPRGRLAVKCTTGLLNDSNPYNNAQSESITVVVRDVGATEILSPHGTISPGNLIVPQGRVQNFGSTRESFKTLFRIGSAYADSALVTNLPPDSAVILTFSPWMTVSGDYIVACSTMLARDTRHENDKVTDDLVVTWNLSIDAGVDQILAPLGTVDSGLAVTPSAVVRNYGTQPANFPVIFKIGDFYVDTCILSLAPNVKDTVSFSPWTAQPRGLLAVKCSTALADDSNPGNNSLTSSVLVAVRDVGAVEILAPHGTVQDEDSVVPRARITNFGSTRESFEAVFRIGTQYAQTVSVSNLEPDSSATVSFPSWYAVRGVYATSCSTMLSTDIDHSNDKVTDNVTVVQRVLTVTPDTSGLILPGGSNDYRLRVMNLGNVEDTVDMSSSGTSSGWTLSLLDSSGQNPLTDHNGNGVPDVGALGSGRVCWIVARVTAPGMAQGNQIDSTRVLGRSGVDTNITDNARIQTTVRSVPAVMISPDQDDSIAPGASIDYLFTVSNLGNIADLIDLVPQKTSQDTGWQYQLTDQFGLPLPDQNRNGLGDVGPLQPFTGLGQVKLRVTAPGQAVQGVTDTVLLWAESGTNPLVKDHVNVLTRVSGQLTALIVAPDQSQRQKPDETQSYDLYVKTQGNMRDVVNLSLECDRTDWQIQLCDEGGTAPLQDSNHDGLLDVGSVESGVMQPFTVKVRAPATSNPGLIGNPDSLSQANIRVIGECATAQSLKDTALLIVQAVPGLTIHNYENPFQDQTRFIFSIPHDGTVRLFLYTRTGELVRRLVDNESYRFGVYTRPWDGRNEQGRKLVPGTYLCVFSLINTAGKAETVSKKVMISSR